MRKIIKLPIKGWWEQDALTDWRKVYSWRPGDKKYAKRLYTKRIRRLPIK